MEHAPRDHGSVAVHVFAHLHASSHLRKCVHLPLIALVLAMATPGLGRSAHADEVFLHGGGMIEGRVIEESKHLIRLVTANGVLAVPTSAVSRRIVGPSRIERYESELDRVELSVQRHCELARWCEKEQLYAEFREHVHAALAIDSQDTEARELAGYAKIGDVWLKINDFATGAEIKRIRGVTPKAIVDRLVGGWKTRVRLIVESDVPRGASEDPVAARKRALMALEAPLSLPAAALVLGQRGPALRAALVEVFGGYEADMARLNQVAVALTDVDRDVREAAALALAKRADARVSTFIRTALRCESETIVNRAARALGWMGDRSAVGDLIDALSTRSFEGRRIEVSTLLSQLEATFAAPILVPLGPVTIEYPSTVLLPDYRDTVATLVSARNQPVGAFRSEVQDALIAITGENFGFEIGQWREWLAKNPALEQAFP